MAIHPNDIFALAIRLKDQGSSEADLRSAVSRSYYAALLSADYVIPERDASLSKDGESSHVKIIARVQAHGGGPTPKPGRSEAIQMAKLLPKMKRDRVIADYHLHATVTQETCDEALRRAEVVMEHCARLQHKLEQAAAA